MGTEDQMTRVLNFVDPFDLEFDILERWPLEDKSCSSVSFDAPVMVALPFANLLKGEEDPFVHVMQEADRVLIPEGTLEIKAPYHLAPHGIGHPFQQRIYSEATWYAFGCNEEQSVATSGEEDDKIVVGNKMQPLDPNKHKWEWWHRIGFPVRMRIMSVQHDEGYWFVFYRKFREDEYVR